MTLHQQLVNTAVADVLPAVLQVNFFAFVAQEVRIGLARLGMRSLDELVGRADLLRQKEDLQLGKTTHLDMSFLTTYAGHEPGDSTQRRNAEVMLAPMLGWVWLSDVCAEHLHLSVHTCYKLSACLCIGCPYGLFICMLTCTVNLTIIDQPHLFMQLFAVFTSAQ